MSNRNYVYFIHYIQFLHFPSQFHPLLTTIELFVYEFNSVEIPHINNLLQHWSFCAWPIAHNTMPSRFFYGVANDKIFFFYGQIIFMFVSNMFYWFTHGGTFWLLPILTIVNNAVTNMEK